MSEIVDFLLARLAEDDSALPADDSGKRSTSRAWWSNDFEVVFIEEDRWRAEIEAKRRIVELHQPGDLLDHYEFGCTCGFSNHRWSQCKGCGAILDDEGELDRGIRNCACPTLRLLALPYADHEHYRQEWRP